MDAPPIFISWLFFRVVCVCVGGGRQGHNNFGALKTLGLAHEKFDGPFIYKLIYLSIYIAVSSAF